MITEILQGSRITVGPPFYAQVNVPLLVAVLGLMAIWPLLAWRRTSLRAAWRSTRIPLIAAIALSGTLMALGMRTGIPILSASLVAAVVAGVSLELGRSLYGGIRQRNHPDGGSANIFAGDRRRLGSYVVHLGVAIFALGVIGSSGFSQETAATLSRGEDVQIGGYAVAFENLGSAVVPGLATVTADLTVTRNDTPIAKLSPARRIHTGWENQPTSDVAVSTSTPQLDDIYVVLSSWDTSGSSVSLRVPVSYTHLTLPTILLV